MDWVAVELKVSARRRDGDVWAATTTPLAITMYGNTAEGARDRAIHAAVKLLEYHQHDLVAYLDRRGASYHFVEESPSIPALDGHMLLEPANYLGHVESSYRVLSASR